jgi:hypothetical protein
MDTKHWIILIVIVLLVIRILMWSFSDKKNRNIDFDDFDMFD